jgi:dCTP deaminase
MTAALIPQQTLLGRLRTPNDAFKIFPTPIAKYVGKGTVDLRVGTVFLSAERSSLPAVKASDPEEAAKLFREVQLRRDGSFTMHPHQFVLASTFEYLAMPLDLSGLIQSRSTYGRMGIIAATAAFVGPGYKGCPTLELVNVGEVAVILKPYEPICQIALFTAAETSVKPSRYQCATRPTFARAERE